MTVIHIYSTFRRWHTLTRTSSTSNSDVAEFLRQRSGIYQPFARKKTQHIFCVVTRHEIDVKKAMKDLTQTKNLLEQFVPYHTIVDNLTQ